MIPPRLVPVLLIDRDRRVVKTVRFGERTYVGDPFNVVRLFNEKEVDEICVLDIDATPDRRSPDFDFIAALASECFMPLSYGGGVATIDHARRLAADGIEKIVVRSHAESALIGGIAHEYGRQAVLGCIDYRDGPGDARVVEGRGGSPLDVAQAMIAAGAGEIILQSIDRDGVRAGMDLAAIARVAAAASVPIVALGGAGDVADLNAAVAAGADAAASGSAFSFIGRLRAVLVTYPEFATRIAGAAA